MLQNSRDGALTGYNSWITKYPEKKINLIILTNKNAFCQDLEHIKNNILKILDGKSVDYPRPRKIVYLNNDDLIKYTGNYTIAGANTPLINISIADGDLKVELTEQFLPFKVYSETKTDFFAKLYPYDLKFRIENDVVKLKVLYADIESELIKMK